MIKTFKHKGLKELFEKGKSAKIRADLRAKCLRKLDAINASINADDLDLPGFAFHSLKGHKPTRYAVKVSANYRITFEFNNYEAYNIDLEDYH